MEINLAPFGRWTLRDKAPRSAGWLLRIEGLLFQWLKDRLGHEADMTPR